MDLRQKAVNVMLGIHLGGAIGVPFEMMSREEILAATDGEGVRGPRFDLDPSTRKIPETRGLAAGATSDGSQLANAVADGLIMAGRYEHELQVLLHLKALWRDAAGWDGTTKRSLYEIDKWYRGRRRSFGIHQPPAFRTAKDEKLWSGAEERDPRHPARRRPGARGKGPSMKIAPLGLYLALRSAEADIDVAEPLEDILQLSRMTHADPVCAVAAYAVAWTVSTVFTEGARAARQLLMPEVRHAEAILALLHEQDGVRFSQAFLMAIDLIDDPRKLWDFGSGGKADSMTTVPMALAIWRRHADDAEPTAAVLEAINAGGDTDAAASTVGAMMGAASGRDGWWPAEWVDALRDRGALAKHLGARLHDVATWRTPPDGYDLDELKRELGYL